MWFCVQPNCLLGVSERKRVAAQPKVAGEGWRLSKGRTKRKIDTAIALVMALDRATGQQSAPPIDVSASVW